MKGTVQHKHKDAKNMKQLRKNNSEVKVVMRNVKKKKYFSGFNKIAAIIVNYYQLPPTAINPSIVSYQISSFSSKIEIVSKK